MFFLSVCLNLRRQLKTAKNIYEQRTNEDKLTNFNL